MSHASAATHVLSHDGSGPQSPHRYDSKSDVWALGCVLFELVTMEPAFIAASLTDLWSRIRTATYRPITRYEHRYSRNRRAQRQSRLGPLSDFDSPLCVCTPIQTLPQRSALLGAPPAQPVVSDASISTPLV